MKKLIIVSISSFIGYDRARIETGTTILAGLTKTSLIFCADSRSQIADGYYMNPHYVDTTNKIHKIGQYFYEIAGITHYNVLSLDSVIVSVFNKKLSFKLNGEQIFNRLYKVLNDVFHSLTPNELDYYHHLTPNFMVEDVFIGGYETDADYPSFYFIEFKIWNKGSYYNVEPLIISIPNSIRGTQG